MAASAGQAAGVTKSLSESLSPAELDIFGEALQDYRSSPNTAALITTLYSLVGPDRAPLLAQLRDFVQSPEEFDAILATAAGAKRDEEQ